MASYILQACIVMGAAGGLLALGVVRLMHHVKHNRPFRWLFSAGSWFFAAVCLLQYLRSLATFAIRPPSRMTAEWFDMMWELSIWAGLGHAFFIAGGVLIVAVLTRR